MNPRDWALITFTILTQMSVGSFLVLGIVHAYSIRKAGMEEADRLSDRVLLAVFLVLILGLIASLFHLGAPWKAYRAVIHINSSWLSREILFSVLFAVIGILFAYMQWKKVASFSVRNIIAWIAAIVGLVLVYSMSRIYMIPTQPAWDSWATPVSFFTTTFLLGSLAISVAFVANYSLMQKEESGVDDSQLELLCDTLRGISIASVVLLGIELVVLPIYMASLAASTSAAVKTAQLMVGPFAWVFVLRVALVFIGAGVFAVFLYQNSQKPNNEKIMGNLVYGAFALVLIAEVLGRVLFYATHVGIGV